MPGRSFNPVCKPGLYIVKTNINSTFCSSTGVHVNNPLQKIPQSRQPRGRCARVSKSLQTPSVFNGFRNAILRKHMKTHDFSIATFSKTWQRIHEFRLVTPSILCTGHGIHKFRAGFLSYAQGTGFTTVVTPRRHYAQGTGSCYTIGSFWGTYAVLCHAVLCP